MNHKSAYVFLILVLIELPHCKKSAQGLLNIILCTVFVPFLKLIMTETFSFTINEIIKKVLHKIFSQEDAFGTEIDLWFTRIFFILCWEAFLEGHSAFHLQLPLLLTLMYLAARCFRVNVWSPITRCTSYIASLYTRTQSEHSPLNYGNTRMNRQPANENNTPGAIDETKGTTNAENSLPHPEGNAIEVRQAFDATSNNYPEPSGVVQATVNERGDAAVLLLEKIGMESPRAPVDASMITLNRAAPAPPEALASTSGNGQSNREENAEPQVQNLAGSDQAAMDDNEWRLVELRTRQGFIIKRHYYNIRTGMTRDA